jgi:hypothetical protein
MGNTRKMEATTARQETRKMKAKARGRQAAVYSNKINIKYF